MCVCVCVCVCVRERERERGKGGGTWVRGKLHQDARLPGFIGGSSV